ncbi:hypothetical protein BGZ76_002996 [Entomortierella beljakovae]|nr:hypothetical protein BGZ76_002996 [Entomortierella beljakovae]
MRSNTFYVAAICLILSCSNAQTVPDIDTLKGPTAATTVPPTGNGTATDPASTTYGSGTTSRLALFVPSTVYKDYPGWLPLYKALVFQGIPVKVTKDISVAKSHSAVIAYQALQSKYTSSSESTTWSNYVTSGKTLIAIGMTSTNSALKTTFGVTPDKTANSNTRNVIVINSPVASVPVSSINSMFDFTDDRDVQIPLWRKSLNTGFSTIGYTASKGTFALGSYLDTAGVNDTRHAITVKTNSNGGKAVAIGIDVGAYVGESNGGKTNGIPRAYAAQYEPGYDNIFRIIKRLYETATPTGLVTSWPVPGNKGVHFAWTYDIDAQDSYQYAYESAKDLQERGIKGTINWQAKITKDAYDVNSFSLYYRNISAVEALGNMELSSHSVSHSPNLLRFPIGTGTEIWNGIDYEEDNYFPFIGQCTGSAGTYNTSIPGATACDTPNESLYFYSLGGSLLGEARVSKYILEAISITGASVKSFRTGHLLYPDAMPQILEATGFKYSSCGAANDQNTHMPYQTFFNMAYNQNVDILEFPMSSSDEDGKINGDWALPGDTKYPDGSYAYQQYQVVKKIAKYGGQYTFLIHPTTRAIPGVEPTFFEDKHKFQQLFAPMVADISYFDNMVGRGEFHTARVNSGIDVAISGNVATVTVVLTSPIVDLTLRVPTAWSFVSSTVGVNVTPGAVVLVNTVPAGTVTLNFQTSGTVATTSAPAPGSAPTTTSIDWTIPTIPAPTPTPAIPRIVDDFSDPQRYGRERNALGFYTGDDNSVPAKTTVQNDWLLLTFVKTSFWYTTLGDNTCNDYSAYNQLNLSIRYPTSTRIGFNITLQETDVSTCTTIIRHSLNATSMINSATVGSDGWLHISTPLTSFSVGDLKNLRAVALEAWANPGQVEINYISFS